MSARYFGWLLTKFLYVVSDFNSLKLHQDDKNLIWIFDHSKRIGRKTGKLWLYK